MAKDSDKKVGARGADKTAGAFPGLLAEENHLDRRSLWRIGWWGVTAVGAVALAVLTNQYAQGWRHDRMAAVDIARQAQSIQSLARETQNDQRQLAAAIETLNSDRDRLYARITVLEQGLDSVTGALSRQTSANTGKTSRAAAPVAAIIESQSATSSSQSASVASVTAPGPTDISPGGPLATTPPVAPVASTAAATTDKSRIDAAKPESPPPIPWPTPAQTAPAQNSAASPAPAQVATNASSSTTTSAASVAPKPIMAPPDFPASMPTEADKPTKPDPGDQTFDTASAKSDDKAVASPVQRTEFAVDLGTANSVGGLRTLWRSLAKTNSDLAPLRPIVILKEGSNGLGMQLRLGAGPLNDAAAAARICATLVENKRPCETTVYDGQRLAIRGADKATPKTVKPTPAQNATPAEQRRRALQQRHSKREEPAASATPVANPTASPPAPAASSEGSTLSQLFRRQEAK